MSLRPVIKPKPRVEIGTQFYYEAWGVNDHILTVIAESETPGYKGYYDYFVRVDMPDGKVTHNVIHGASIFDSKSIYARLVQGIGDI